MKRLQSTVAGARTKDSMRALTKLCRTVDGELRIVGNPPLVTPIEDVLPGAEQEHLEDVVRRMIGTYRLTLPRDRRELLESYRYVHAARKVVGVGSVGARTWILLLTGRDEADPLFLQFKEAQASVLEPFLGKSEFEQHGQRVVEGQRMMQAAPDVMLGWERIITIDGVERDFYIRQLWDSKGSAEVEVMDPAELEAYGRVCGWTLARAHARSGDRIAIAAYLGAWRRVRPRHGDVRRDVRRPERTGLPGAGSGGDVGPRRGRAWRLTRAARADQRRPDLVAPDRRRRSDRRRRRRARLVDPEARPPDARRVRRRGLLAAPRRRRRAVRATARVHRRDRVPELRRHAEQRQQRGRRARGDRARQRRLPAARQRSRSHRGRCVRACRRERRVAADARRQGQRAGSGSRCRHVQGDSGSRPEVVTSGGVLRRLRAATEHRARGAAGTASTMPAAACPG